MRIVGGSMAPTVRSGELVWIDAQAYRRRAPRQGDVVAARPRALGGHALVKRVAALPHERVEWHGRRWELGSDQFFLLGDALEQSLDSRHFGPVSRAELIGWVRVRLWPWTVLSSP